MIDRRTFLSATAGCCLADLPKADAVPEGTQAPTVETVLVWKYPSGNREWLDYVTRSALEIRRHLKISSLLFPVEYAEGVIYGVEVSSTAAHPRENYPQHPGVLESP